MIHSEDQKKSYHIRYTKVIKDLNAISKMEPREGYMYRLMDTVIFQDFETALDTIIEDYRIANDNEK
ncbi:MAG: hypothetical protein AAF549_09010 [Pseudomonadota bacterium]